MAFTFIEGIVYGNITWSDAKQGDSVLIKIETKESKKVDPHSCAIKVFVDQAPQLKTVGHISRDIFRHVFFFLK